jgi:hypothetical protein
MCTVVSESMSTVTTAIIASQVDTPTLQVGPTPSAPQPLDGLDQVILARVRVDHGRHETAMPGEALRQAAVVGQRRHVRAVADHTSTPSCAKAVMPRSAPGSSQRRAFVVVAGSRSPI